MPVSQFTIHSRIRDYDVLVEDSADFIDALIHGPRSCLIVDENVWRIYAESIFRDLRVEDVMVLPISEDLKRLESVQKIYDRLVTYSAKRNLTMISIGGGILQDISGFAASTVYRGINWIFVPTTLLAQADSCIGGKTSLNYQSYKNLIGTFFPPFRIHIYPKFLQTQLEADFLSGYGEVLKLHIMGGEESYEGLVRLSPLVLRRDPGALLQVISNSLQVKMAYMADDEFDRGRRNLLNFGHDFGHALESTSHFEIPHGQAVILGMLAANLISRRRGLLEPKMEQHLAESLLLPGLVAKPSIDALDAQAMIDAMKKDKKRTSADLALIMMDNRFEFHRVDDLTAEEVVAALDNVRGKLGYLS
jgi:3-dehydroquinate synthase